MTSKDEDSLGSKAPFAKFIVILSNFLDSGLYLTNALSSFWRDTPVNCATTILLNPVAFEPSARTPFIPNTERSDTLKI